MPGLKALIRQHKTELLESIQEKEEKLIAAAHNNDRMTTVRVLDTAEVNINCRAELADWTALHIVSSSGNIDLMKILIKRKADVNATDVFGCTPLFYAARNGHSDAVHLLLNNGASTGVKNKWGETVMDYTAEEFRSKVAMHLESFSSHMVDVVDITPSQSPRFMPT